MKSMCNEATYVFKNGRKIIQCNAEKPCYCFSNDFMQVNENIVNVNLPNENNTKKVKFVCENNIAAIIFTEQLRDIICGEAWKDIDFYDIKFIFNRIKHGKFFCLEISKQKLLYCLKEKFKNNSLKNVMIGLAYTDIGMLLRDHILEEINTFIDNNGNAICTVYGDYRDIPEDMIRISFWYDKDDLLE